MSRSSTGEGSVCLACTSLSVVVVLGDSVYSARTSLSIVVVLGDSNAILNRHAFETQQTILEYLPKKAKIKILIEHPNPTFINETRIKGMKITNPDPMIINES
jgi:hypothetical protein